MKPDQFAPFKPVLAPIHVAGLASSIVKIISHYTAETYNLDAQDILGRSRIRQIAFARQIAFYIAKCMTKWSTPEIGRRFGNRDHTTVLSGLKKIDRCCREDPIFLARVEGIRRNVVNATKVHSQTAVPGERKQDVPEQSQGKEGFKEGAGAHFVA